MTKKLLFSLAVCLFVPSVAPAIDLLDTIDKQKWNKEKLLREASDPAVFPQFAKEIEIANKFPRIFSGTVYLDGKPAGGMRVTDGMSFVATGPDGRYTITIQPDAMQPYLPNRTISVCWPDNTFPARDEKTGDLLWWRCVADFKDKPDKVDFRLVTRKYRPPLVVAFASDPHDSLTGPHNRIWGEEIKQGSSRVDLAILGGDLTYADFKGADACFGAMRKYTRDFPLPLLHVQGNHDFTAPMFGPHPNAGFGPFTRYLGPIRWSFDACGVHIASMNYWLANADSAEWLRRDLLAAGGKPTYLFVHSWGSHTDEICQKFPNVRLVQGGHSHTTLPSGTAGNAEFWCYHLYYRLIYIDGQDFDFVERDVAVNPLYRYSRQNWTPGGEHVGVKEKTLKNQSVAVPCFAKSNHYDIKYTVAAKEATARRMGLRITAAGGQAVSFHYDKATETLHMAGRETYLALRSLPRYAQCRIRPPVGEDGLLDFRINIQPDRLQCTMNGVISYVTFLKVGPASKVEIFADDGAATFKSADVWEKGSPVVDWNGYRREPRTFKAAWGTP